MVTKPLEAAKSKVLAALLLPFILPARAIALQKANLDALLVV